MFERLMLCHYAVADITGANPNVFYELGIRHAHAAAQHRDPVRRGDRAAVRHRAGARHSLPDRRRRRAGRIRERRSPTIAAQLTRGARGNPHDDSPICSSCSTTCRARRSITPRPTCSARASTIPSDTRSALARRGARRAPTAVEKIAAEPALANLMRGGSRRRRRSVPVAARRRSPRGDDRAVRAHAAAAAARQDDARAARLRAQSRRAASRRRRRCSRGDRRVRPVERDQRPARPHLQGSLGRAPSGKARSEARSAAQAGHRDVSRRVSRPIGAMPIPASTR